MEIINNFQQSFGRTNVKSPIVVKPAIKEEGMRAGSRVIHDKFGYGIILNIASNVAQVAFEKSDVKKVLIDYLQYDKWLLIPQHTKRVGVEYTSIKHEIG